MFLTCHATVRTAPITLGGCRLRKPRPDCIVRRTFTEAASIQSRSPSVVRSRKAFAL
jgi:hypothetical protein